MKPLAAHVVELPQPEDPFCLTVGQQHQEITPWIEMHPGCEIVLLLSGAQERYCEQHWMRIEPGNVSLIGCWESHSWRMLVPETTALVAYFSPEFLGDLHFDNIHWLSLFAPHPKDRPCGSSDKARRRLLNIASLIQDSVPGRVSDFESASITAWGHGGPRGAFTTWILGATPEDRPPAWETAVRVWLTEILLILYQDWGAQQDYLDRYHAHSGDLVRIMPALELGAGGDGELVRVSLKEAADACGFSVSQFRSIFRRTMGVSFGRFELARRLGQAARLLVTTDDSVESIADRCGFTDRSHLLRMFRQRYGKTPAAFRGEARESSEQAFKLVLESAEVGGLGPG